MIHPSDPTYQKQRFTTTPQGYVVPLLAPKGYEVFDSYKRYLLVEGCRKSGKSIAIGNKVMRHSYETDGAVTAIVCKTLKVAKEGIWRDLTNFIMPGWVDQGIVRLVEGPKMEPDTKMHFFVVSNQFGGTSEIQLHSLEHAEQVEAKFKGTRFSMVWVSEADQFNNRIVMDILGDQLRIIGIPYEHHQMILDCNPPEDGEDHWLHDTFFKEADSFEEWSQTRGRIHFELNDNPFLPEEEKKELINKYKYDEIKRKRFVEGLWVKDTTASHFDGYFLPNIHIVGRLDPDEIKSEYIVPDRLCESLVGGFDIGSVNHAFGLWIPRVNRNDEISYDALDELVVIDKPVSLYDFTHGVMEILEKWEKWSFDRYNINLKLRFWGDSSMHNFNPHSNSTDAAIIFHESNAKIAVQPYAKGKHSVRARIGLAKRLFNDGRLYFSSKTPWAIDWARHLKPGLKKGEDISPSSVRYKHKFDADTYIFASELPNEIERRERPATFNGVTSIR